MSFNLSFDFASDSVTSDDRARINLALQRFGWDPVGGSNWQYPALGKESVGPEDFFNSVVTALFYVRSLVVASGIQVTKYSFKADSRAYYAERKEIEQLKQGIGFPILSAEDLPISECINQGDSRAAKLSKPRLRQFFQDAENSLK
jgi:hypothetical protein